MALNTSKFGQIMVQKYGGTSVGTTEKIQAVAERICECLNTIDHLVVVLSAMGKTTDQLMSLAHQVSHRPTGREKDLLLSTGEQVSISLLGLALQDKGIPAISLTAAQCGIRTTAAFSLARIQSIDTDRILKELSTGRVVIVPGFQGISSEDEITTLGRGGSDITAAGLAAALSASACEIYTDVDGVMSADPSIVPKPVLWPEISFEEAIEMASSGAKVLHPRAAEICMAYKIPIHVRSSFHMKEGTWIRGGTNAMEQAEIVGVSSDKEIAKVTLLDVPDQPGSAARVFQDLAASKINVRMIIQGASSENKGRITLIIDTELIDNTEKLIENWKKDGITTKGVIEQAVAKISIVGSRLSSTPGLASRMFHVLAREGINIDCISSSEMRIACVIADKHLAKAVQAIHDEFL